MDTRLGGETTGALMVTGVEVAGGRVGPCVTGTGINSGAQAVSMRVINKTAIFSFMGFSYVGTQSRIQGV
jgi:hypothetical protein